MSELGPMASSRMLRSERSEIMGMLRQENQCYRETKPEAGSPRPPASVVHPKRWTALRSAIIPPIRTEHVSALTDADETLSLWDRIYDGYKVLIRPRRHIQRKQIELVVAAEIDPAISFHHERVALLIENAEENLIVSRRGSERRSGQPPGVLADDVEVGDRACLVGCRKPCFRAEKDQLLIPDEWD